MTAWIYLATLLMYSFEEQYNGLFYLSAYECLMWLIDPNTVVAFTWDTDSKTKYSNSFGIPYQQCGCS